MVEAHHYQEIFKMVSIPRLKQIQPSSGLPSNDRINLNVRDQSANIQNRTNQLVNLGDTALKVDKAYEDDKIDTLSSEANQAYNEWSVQKLQELKNHKGDPTDAYAQYDLDEKEFFDGLRDSRPNLNERVRNGVESKLAKSQGSQRIRVLEQRGYQKEVYENNLFESDVKLDKKHLSVDISRFKLENATTTFPFDRRLIDLKEKIVKRGIKQGTAEIVDDPDSPANYTYTNEDGEEIRVKVSDTVTNRVNKETSEGVYEALNTMITSGELDKAKALNVKYAPHLTSTQRTRINTKLGKEDIKKQASEKLAKLSKLTEEKKIQAIENEKDPVMKKEMASLKLHGDNAIKSLRNNLYDNNTKKALTIIAEMDKQGKVISERSITEDKKLKALMSEGRMSSTQREMILERFNTPKISRDSSVAKLSKLKRGKIEGMDISTMPVEKFQEFLVGLDETDKRREMNSFNKMNDVMKTSKTKGQSYLSTQSNGLKLLKIKLNSRVFKVKSNANLSKRDKKVMNGLQDEFSEFMLPEDGKTPTMIEANEWLDGKVDKLARNKTFSIGEFLGNKIRGGEEKKSFDDLTYFEKFQMSKKLKLINKSKKSSVKNGQSGI